MFLQSPGAKRGNGSEKKLLVDDKITACVKQMSPGCYISVKVRIEKHCLAKHFS